VSPTADSLPTEHDHPLHPPAELFGDRLPLRPLDFPDDQRGWLVTRHDAARAVLADPRFSAQRHLIEAGTDEPDPAPEPVPGFFISMDPPRHTRYRGALTGMFTMRRSRLLTDRITRVVDEHLDALVEAGPPADLVSSFTDPVPLLVICELLGVPAGDRDEFRARTSRMTDLSIPEEEGDRAHAEIVAYLADLVRERRSRPGTDLLSDLLTAEPDGGPFTDVEVAGIGSMLLNAGYETTACVLGLGLAALLADPAQLAAVRAAIDDPGAVSRAVEEVLRHQTPLHRGIPRVATEDVEVAGTHVMRGQRVLVSVAAVNRDPDRFDESATFDATRARRTHLGFGHGPHQCLGQELARVELRVAVVRLLRRLPDLTLAVDPADLAVRPDALLHGIELLPVVW
jgi:cytochrome P450